jgi:hypothetical protein
MLGDRTQHAQDWGMSMNEALPSRGSEQPMVDRWGRGRMWTLKQATGHITVQDQPCPSRCIVRAQQWFFFVGGR